jgi:hypothetical protein
VTSDTLWDKVSGESSAILEVKNNAVRALEALADKIEGKSKSRELKAATKDIEFEVALQLSVLARCFYLHWSGVWGRARWGKDTGDHLLSAASRAVA